MPRRSGLQKRTAKALQALGFAAISSTTFSRQRGEQLHYVGLQYRRFSSDFTFNLGCHFRGVPSLFDYDLVELGSIEELDSGLRCRVGCYIGDGRHDIWWDSANSEIQAALAQVSWAIERAFDDCIQKWGLDGGILIGSHVKNRAGAIYLSRPLLRWMPFIGRFERLAFVSLLAHHHGRNEFAKALHKKALLCKDSIIEPHVLKLAAALSSG